MTDDEYTRKLDELDRLLNDPDVPMQPEKIWSLLAELVQRDAQAGGLPQPVTPAFGAGLGVARLNCPAE